MQLIIAEKPSLAMNIANSIAKKRIDNLKRYDGYLKGDKYIISFAYGHLFGLLDVEEYFNQTSEKVNKTKEKIKWTMENLPFIPESFEFKLKTQDGIAKQFNVLKKLIQDSNVTQIIHCGDADREGEIIIRLILKKSNNKKPVKRLWLFEQTEETIIKCLENPQDDEKYDNLANEGFARTYMDWLLGINLTRLLTLKSGKFLPVGRVLIPIVKFIYDKDRSISDFTPIDYLQVESKTEIEDAKVNLVVDEPKFPLEEKEKAITLANLLNQHKGIVKSIETKRINKKPSKLFSLSKLQSYLSKKHKISLKDSLQVIQKLYEKGYITYPRTNTEYLAENEKDKVKHLISVFNSVDFPIEFKDRKSIFDNKKIESHSAITQTAKIPKENELQGDEILIYSTIKNRFICNFLCEDALIDQTIMTIVCGDYEFLLKGNVIIQKGYLAIEPISSFSENGEDNILPNLKVGDIVPVDFKPSEKQTSPPKKINSETLINLLKNPYRNEINNLGDEDEDYKAILSGIEIGTEATRTSIIEHAKKYNYIEEKNGIYSILPDGVYLIELLDKLSIDLYTDKTVSFSKDLKQIYNNNLSIQELMQNVKTELASIFDVSKNTEIIKLEREFSSKEVIGICPNCGGDILEGEKNYYCGGYKNGCKFVIFKSNKFLESMGKKVTKTIVKAWLNKRKAKVIGLKGKSGKVFDAYINVEWTQPHHTYTLEFINKK